ncbi:unnamed protein product [Gongylonema pulchrum]|uniref:TFIIA_gamma_C domain-containing protein n=1 Tax=Gongylonema pulchrum TaxID=637853 RepID=A0A183D2A3_9BILA|nr:unnamed protein product [Gongylonema pulchrum]
MAYQLYRSTTLGIALRSTLDEYVEADKLKAYRFCDNVWTFVMENVEFRDVTQPIDGTIDRVKIVACDANAAKLVNT